MNVKLTIDGIELEVEEGTTIVDAAAEIGINIPTLCYSHDSSFSKCMVCSVWSEEDRSMIPACSVFVRDGMQIVASGDRVETFRREMLEILLSEHKGDCKAPCQLVCPMGADIPDIFRKIENGEFFELPDCSDCSAPCEKACRRGRIDEPIGIRDFFASAEVRELSHSCMKEKNDLSGYNHKWGGVSEQHKEILVSDLARSNTRFQNYDEICRCLQCGCSADHACLLQSRAEELQVKQASFKVQSINIQPKIFTEKLIYDPNKCIRCMRCTTVKNHAGHSLCITGKGMGVYPGAPLNLSWQSVTEGIEEQLIAICPTGAMSAC